MDIIQKVLSRKEKPCRQCRGYEGGPPCYDCTFNLQHPPPQYTSVFGTTTHPYARKPTQNSSHPYARKPTQNNQGEQATNNLLSPHYRAFDDSPVPLPILVDPERDVTTLAHSFSHIGLSLMFAGQEVVNSNSRGLQSPDIRIRHHSDTTVFDRGRQTQHECIARNTSAPQLQEFGTQVPHEPINQHNTPEPQETHESHVDHPELQLDHQEMQVDQQELPLDNEGRSRSSSPNPRSSPNLLLSALTTPHIPGDPVTHHPHLSSLPSPDQSPLPSQLFIPE